MAPTQIGEWRRHLLERAAEVFERPGDEERRAGRHGDGAQDRAAGAGAGFFGTCARSNGRAERQEQIDPEHALPVSRQCELLGVARSTVYYRPEPVRESDLALMRLLDELHLERPFLGSRRGWNRFLMGVLCSAPPGTGG